METWRDLVTGVLVITAVFVATASFIYLTRDEFDTFQASFDNHKLAIEDAANILRLNIRDGFTSMEDTIVAYAQNSNAEWPFVTVPFFELHGAHARDIAHVDFFSFSPRVEESKRSEWESYSVNNQWWLQDSQNTTVTASEREEIISSLEKSIPDRIYGLKEGEGDDVVFTTDIGTGPYFPLWEMSPPPADPGTVNFHVFSEWELDSLYEAMAVMNEPVWSETRIGTLENASLPQSVLLYPVHETFDDASDIVGFLQIYINWQTLLRWLLPAGEGGFYIVLNNTCGDIHTFEHQDDKNIYLGEGDLHDELYDRLGFDTPLFHHEHPHDRPCDYSIFVYPTSVMRHEYKTMIPAVFTTVIAVAFFLMAFFFFAYDRYVTMRNNKVLLQAAKSNAIVSSLFPVAVRERLFNNENSSNTKGKRSSRGPLKLKNFLLGEGGDQNEMQSRPIADLFPNCTGMYRGSRCGLTLLALQYLVNTRTHILFLSSFLVSVLC